MADSEIDRFERLAQLIIGNQQDDDMREELQDWIREYSTELRDAAAAKAGTAEARRQAEVIAKSLPGIAQGIQGAVKGFQAGDPFAGSAAVADTIGSMVTMISSIIGSSAGPPGAVVSSLLSIFSMFIKIFSNQKPEKSIEEKLQSVIDVHDAKELIDSLQAVQSEINIALKDIIDYKKTKSTYPLVVVQNKLDLERKGLLLGEAGNWINRNQNVEHWEAVLSAHCYAYIALMQTVTMALNILEDAKDIQLFVVDLNHRNEEQLKFIKSVKHKAQNQGTVWAVRSRNLNGNGPIMFGRNGVVSAKKDWRKYNIGYTPISFAVANRILKDDGGTQKQTAALFTLNSTYPFQSHIHWDRNKATLINHPFRKYVDGASVSGILDARYGLIPLSTNAKKHTMAPFNSEAQHDYFDVWALSGHGSGEIDLYTAEGNKIVFWRQGSKEHTDYNETRLLFRGGFDMPEGYKVGAVRASVVKSFENESDTLTKDVIHGVYGACEVQANKSVMGTGGGGLYMPPYYENDHMEIKVTYRGITWDNGHIEQPKQSFFLAPWPNYVGLAIDSHYIWVFKAGAIACATHTEVYNSLMKGETNPPWMEYTIPNKVGETEYNPEDLYELMGKFYPKGLLDLSSCDDGTLTAVYCEGVFYQAPIYSMTPKIDRDARKLIIEGTKEDSQGHPMKTQEWQSDRTMWVSRVIKQPINCWPVLTGLEKVLESQLKDN